MRLAVLIGSFALLSFVATCAACVALQHWFGLSVAETAIYFFLATLVLLAAFIWAGVELAAEHRSFARAVAGVVFALGGFSLSWVLGMNAGRAVAGLLGLPM